MFVLLVGPPADGEPATVAARLEAYRTGTAPVFVWYEAGGLLRPIAGVGGVDEVAARVRTAPRREPHVMSPVP